MNNDIIGIIPRTNLKTGLFSSKSFSLIVTPEEIIAALITKEMLQNTAKEASEKAKEDGKGFFKRLAATAISGINFHERYTTMSLDEIRQENPENFSITLTEITKIKTKIGDIESNSIPDTLEIHTSSKKFVFNLQGYSAGEAKNLLKQVIPDKV